MYKPFFLFLLLLFCSIKANAVSIGGGIGYVQVDPLNKSSLEETYPEAKDDRTSSAKWSLSLQAHHEFNKYLFIDLGASTFSYLEKNISYTPSDNPENSFTVVSKETTNALHGSLGISYHFLDNLAVYAKGGTAIHQTIYSIRQKTSEDVNQDEKSNTNYTFKLYGGGGLLYKINKKYTIKLEYEEFGTVGNHAKVDTIKIPGTDKDHKSGGIYIKRYIINFLVHIF